MRGTKAKRLRRLQRELIQGTLNPPRKVRRLEAWLRAQKAVRFP